MIIQKNINFDEPLTDEQVKMLEALKSKPVVSDDDCPELTEEQLQRMKRISETNQEERRKQTVTLRLSPKALRTAKSLGKGYTSVLSRILENALSDSNIIEHFL